MKMKVVLIVMLWVYVVGSKHNSDNKVRYLMKSGSKQNNNKDGFCIVNFKTQKIFGNSELDSESDIKQLLKQQVQGIQIPYQRHIEMNGMIDEKCGGYIDLGLCYSGTSSMLMSVEQSVEFMTNDKNILSLKSNIEIIYDSKDDLCELVIKDSRKQYSNEQNGEIILTYSLGQERKQYQTMLQMVQKVTTKNTDQIKKCYNILQNGPSKNIYFYVNGNNMVGNLIKNLIHKNGEYKIRCRKSVTVETQDIQMGDQNIKPLDPFKDTIMYSSLKFIKNKDDSRLKIVKLDDGGYQVNLMTYSGMKVDQKQCYDITRKNLNLGSTQVAVGSRLMTIQFKVYSKEEKNQKDNQACYYYGYKNNYVQNELLFVLPLSEGCELTEDMLTQQSSKMQFLVTSRSFQGAILFSYFNSDHEIYCHVIDYDSDKTNNRNNRISRYINSFCSHSSHSQQEDKNYIQQLSDKYDKQKDQEEIDHRNTIQQYVQQSSDMTQQYSSQKIESNQYYNRLADELTSKVKSDLESDNSIHHEQVRQMIDKMSDSLKTKVIEQKIKQSSSSKEIESTDQQQTNVDDQVKQEQQKQQKQQKQQVDQGQQQDQPQKQQVDEEQLMDGKQQVDQSQQQVDKSQQQQQQEVKDDTKQNNKAYRYKRIRKQQRVTRRLIDRQKSQDKKNRHNKHYKNKK